MTGGVKTEDREGPTYVTPDFKMETLILTTCIKAVTPKKKKHDMESEESKFRDDSLKVTRCM